ncbi:MAG: class I SAM-dependent methyltransferase [Hyperionvirus sp.]|uniref:Class I SAM-dependent methyltransferase n=1 Tax=Hyperionvirus sp. TaxID=2487770 RepID=A0A3G5ACH3_9VIRU|nr:MAG: class I SAM-dependent methyltransferase [Hyperionvirus sp.]
MKYLLILCASGLGNLLLPFISGLLIAKETNRKFIIYNPFRADGNISLGKLIILDDPMISIICNENDLKKELQIETIRYYRPTSYPRWFLEINENFANDLDRILNPTNVDVVENYDLIPGDSSECIVACTSGNWISNDLNNYTFGGPLIYNIAKGVNKYKIKGKFKELQVNVDVQKKVNDYIVMNNIDHNTFGIHFRLTDVKNQQQFFYDVIRIKQTVATILMLNNIAQFFICSDESQIEKDFIDQFGSDRIRSYTKKHYSQLLNGNIVRNENVMLEGFIDLLILSSTTMIPELSNLPLSGSTYNSMAKALTNDVKYLTGPMKSFSVLTTPDICHAGGYSYAIELKEYQGISDSTENPNKSELILYEDEIPLKECHSLHEYIRNIGEGRYSHWDKHIYFSTSDNSDPTTNGKIYKAVIYN